MAKTALFRTEKTQKPAHHHYGWAQQDDGPVF
jgi:hypothetical protein